ncbi:hypothetical protein Bca4012_017776 [Brassica carinata]
MSRRFSRKEKEKWVPSGSNEPKRSPVRIPPSNNNDLITANKLTIIGKVTNPQIQRPRAVVDFLPQVWNLEGRVTGRDLGPEKFQIKFESEDDLLSVLSKGPYHYKRWMLLLQRWEPTVAEAFPSNITFWLRVHDLTLHFWNNGAMEVIGKELGFVADKKSDEAKVRIEMNGLLPLAMNLEVRLPSDEVTTVEFEYLKLEKHCFTCFSLLHEETECPARSRNQLSPKERKLGITQRIALQRIEAEKKHHDDRRGYSRSQVSSRMHRASESGRDHRHSSRNYGESYRSPRRSPIQQDVHRRMLEPDRRNYHSRNSSRDQHLPRNYTADKELSSGKIVSGSKSLQSNHIAARPLGDDTSKDNTSYNSRTPPSRSVRDRLEHPSEPSSERTLTTSREKRSALKRLESDLRNTPQLSNSRQASSGKRKERTNRLETTPPQDHIREKEANEGSRARIPAALRLQEPAPVIETVTVSIPPSQSKSAGKRRVTSSARRVP